MSLTVLTCLEPDLHDIADLPSPLAEQLQIKAHYAGYLAREAQHAQQAANRGKITIPADMDFSLPGMSREVCEKLSRVRPLNLGQAERISGITPAALSILSIYLHKQAANK
jgi:tRNA uridine 5-carboxymethylaminomethyl modification enzyme